MDDILSSASEGFNAPFMYTLTDLLKPVRLRRPHGERAKTSKSDIQSSRTQSAPHQHNLGYLTGLTILPHRMFYRQSNDTTIRKETAHHGS